MSETLQPIKLTIKGIDLPELQSKYVQILSSIAGQPLTKTELKMMMVLITDYQGILSAEARKGIKTKCQMSIAHINNYIGNIREKGLIIDKNEVAVVHPLLAKPVTENQQVILTFTKA